MSDNTFFVTGGTLPPDASSYVSRQADADLYDALAQGQYCYLLNTRQMGKSSLVVRTADRLRQDFGASVAIFELSAIGQNISPDQLYYGLCNLLGQQLHLEDEFDDFWFDNETLSPMQRFFESIRCVALERLTGPVIIVVDEVDVLRTVQKHFSTDEFFGGIRDCHNRRATQPEFRRLTFCLVGVATPSDLIQDTRVSPFNIGQRIVITDFTEEEAGKLAVGLGVNGTRLLSRVLYWTGGHPHLTQRLCYQLTRREAPQITDVDTECQQLFLSKTARESDDNLTFVRDRLLRSSDQRVEDILDLYARVRSGQPVYDDDANPLIATLRLSGIVRVADNRGRFAVRNRIYEQVFDAEFIRNSMPDAERRRQALAARRGRLQVGAIATGVILALSIMLWFTVDAERRAQADALHARQAEQEAAKNLRALQDLSGTFGDLTAKLEKTNGEYERVQSQLYTAKSQAEKARKKALQVNQVAEQSVKQAQNRLRAAQAKLQDVENLAKAKTDAAEKAAEARQIAERKTETAEKAAREAQASASAEQQSARDAHTALEAALANLGTAQTEYKKAKADADQAHADADQAVTTARAAREEVMRLTTLADRLNKKRQQQTYINNIISAQNELLSGIYFTRPNNSPSTSRPLPLNVGVFQTGNIGRAEELLRDAKDSYDFPGFEWFFLNRQCHIAGNPTSVALEDGVAAVAFHPLDNSLIAANTAGVVLQTRNGKQISFGTARFRTVALSPGGQYFIGGNGKGEITLWETSAATPLLDRRKLALSAINALAISRGRNPRLIAGTAAGRVVVCRLNGESVGRLTFEVGPHDPIRAVALDEPGERALIATEKETSVYEVSTGKRVQVMNGVQGAVSGASFFPSGTQVALITTDNRLHFYDVTTGTLLGSQPIDAQVKSPQTIAFTAQGVRLAIGGASSVVSTKEIMTPDPIQRTSAIASLEFTPDSRQMALATATDLSLPDMLEPESLLFAHARTWGSCLRFSPDGNLFAVGGRDGSIELFDKRNISAPRQLQKPGGPAITRLAFSPDGTRFSAGRQNGQILVWNLNRDLPPMQFSAGSGRTVLLTFLPDTEHLLVASIGSKVQRWTLDGQRLEAIPLEDSPTVDAAATFSARDNRLAVAVGKYINLYNVKTGKREATCAGHINAVSCLDLSLDGRRLVSGSKDGTVRLWETETGEQVIAFRGSHYWYDPGQVTAVAFAPNNRSLAVGTDGGKAIILRATDD